MEARAVALRAIVEPSIAAEPCVSNTIERHMSHGEVS